MNKTTYRPPIFTVLCSLLPALAFSANAKASPYDTVMSFGSDYVQVAQNAAGQQYLLDTNTGASYAFTNTATTASIPGSGSIWSSKQAYEQAMGKDSLPGAYGYQGAEYPQYVYFSMTALSSNSQGTLIGGLPDGASRAMPYLEQDLGYTQKQPDGTYGPFHQLSVPTLDGQTASVFKGGGFGVSGSIALNGANQILFTPVYLPYPTSSAQAEGALIDLNTGTTKTISQLLSPQDLKLYLAPPIPIAFADNGSILASAVLLNGQQVTLLLSPPDTPLPEPVPEPAPLATMCAAIGFAIYRKRRHKSRQSLVHAG